MEGFMGRLHPVQCNHYKPLCHKFMKCFGNCEDFFIPASDLNEVNQEDLTDEQKERAKTIKTNPCVAMFAYCLSVDYFQLAAVLDLTTPDAF
ncbi:2-oxoglutarate-acceptor oxidoreductase subunit OorD domain protein [Cooperia oncophora]